MSSRLDGGVSAVVIEATEPVAYVTTQPDPLTVLVDLRNVTAGGVQLPTTKAPVRDVRVEQRSATDGTPLARVRVNLERAAPHRVRTSRNLIVVEVDNAAPAGAPAAAATAATVTTAAAARVAATELRAVRASRSGDEVTIALVGNGELKAAAVQEAADLPPRVLLDFAGVAAARAVPAVLGVNQADVARVRVARNSIDPLVTRVVVDLKKKMPYRVESSGSEGEELRVIFGAAEVVDAPAMAAAPAPAPAVPAPAEPAPVVTLAPEPTPVLTPEVAAAAAPRPTPATLPLVPTLSTPAAPTAVIGSPATTPAPAMVAVAAAQPPPPAAQPPSGEAQGPRFTGHPVSLDFQGADLRAVLRTFAEISGLNVVIDPTITGSVDVSLRDVPWDQALDIILKANKLGYYVDGSIVRIAPLGVLADEEAQRRKLADEQALAGELRVFTRPLSYAKASDLIPILTRSALSSRGEVQVDPRTNTVIIRDLPDRLTAAAELMGALDMPQPQVEIEARIVQTSRDFARSLGVEWGINGRVSPELGNTTPLAFPNNGSITGRTGSVQGPDLTPTGVNLGVANASSALGLALGSINGALNLDVALSALEQSGQGRLLSTPRVSTQNNVEAEITQGVQIPIQTVANNTVTVTFKDAALTLKVTPQITASNTVIMRVFLENAAPDYSRAVVGIPPIDTQRAVTSVLVGDGETTVIGGIYLSREQAVQGRTPGLHRIPLLGWLFKRDEVSDESRELLIFITPRITKG